MHATRTMYYLMQAPEQAPTAPIADLVAHAPTMFDGTWWEPWHHWIVDNAIGDYVGILGLFGIIAAIVTAIASLYKSKAIATAVERSLKEIHLAHCIADLSSAIQCIAEIQRMQRNRQWPALPDHYSTARRLLLGIPRALISQPNAESLDGAISKIRDIQSKVVAHSLNAANAVDEAKLQKVTSKIEDELHAILATLKQTTSR